MLLESNAVYDDVVLHSKCLLNCPKSILNDVADAIYRQFHDNKNEAIKSIGLLLRKFKFSNPVKLATNFVEWRSNISMKEFNQINVNSYIDNCPKQVLDMAEYIDNFIKAHTKEEWLYGRLISSTVTKEFHYKEPF